MPNHVRNVVTIKHLKPNQIEEVLSQVTSQTEEDMYPLNCVFDFDKLIPEPRTEAECPEDCKVNKDSHVEKDRDRPWFDWYTWRNKYWNTKWGAYDCYTKIGKSQITFVFSTAWSLAIPIVHKLELLGYDFEWRYADEDYGSNCGKITYDAKECIGHHDYEKDLPNPRDFARRLWDY